MTDETYYQEMIKEYKKSLAVVVESLNILEQQNAALLEALTEILSSNTKPVHGIDGKTIKGYTLYIPAKRLWKAFDVSGQALAQVGGE